MSFVISLKSLLTPLSLIVCLLREFMAPTSVRSDSPRLSSRNQEVACGQLQYEVGFHNGLEFIGRTNTIIKRIVLGTGPHVHLAARPTDPAYTGMLIPISHGGEIMW